MFFNVDADDGYAISGWVAPDNPSASARLVVVIPDREDLIINSDIPRPDIRELGIHATGNVGFRIDTLLIHDLETLPDVEVLSEETRLPLYRRFQPGRHIERKMFVFDSAVMPQRRVLKSIGEHFALFYSSAECLPLETMIVLLNNHYSKSLFFTGRPLLNRYSSYLESCNYIRVALLRDPYEELAERLLFLNFLSKSEGGHELVPIYCTGLMPLLTLAKGLVFNDRKALLTSFRSIDDEQRQAITSPMTRMYGCSLDEAPTYRHVSVALEHLAGLDVVGTRARYDVFRGMIAHLLGAPVFGHDEPSSFKSVHELANALAQIGIVADLLESDVRLYTMADQAITESLERV